MSSWPVATESIKAHAEPAWQIGVLCVLLLLAAAAHAAPVMVVDSQSEYWLPLDAEGWTVLPEATVDTKPIYVSSSTGNDTTGDGSIGAPYATIAKAFEESRNGAYWWQQPGYESGVTLGDDVTWYEDRILLKCGDTWDENAPAMRPGPSPEHPMVLSSYGSGERPVVTFMSKASNYNYCFGNWAVIGIEFTEGIAYNNSNWSGTWNEKPDYVLIEDCVSRGINLDNIDMAIVRRSIITDNYSTVAHAQGSYMYDTDNMLIEECVYDHNGWLDEDPLIQGGVTNEDRAYSFVVSCSGTTITITRTDPTTDEIATFSLSSSKVYTSSSELIINASSGTWNLDDIDIGDVSDSFTDGDYTSSPEWTVDSGTWSAAGGDLVNTSSGQVSIEQTDADYEGGFTCTMDSDGLYYIYLRYTDASNCVRLSMNSDGMVLLSKKTGEDDVSAACFAPKPTIYNHNLYIKENCEGFTFRNCITARASSHGCQMRTGGDCINNLFLENPLALSWGHVEGSPITVGGVSGEVTNNVVLGDADICRPRPSCSDNPRGHGLMFGNVASGTCSGNIISTAITGSTNNTGIELDSDLSDNTSYAAGVDVGINNFTLQSNIVYEWDGPLHFRSSEWNNVTVAYNDIQESAPDNPVGYEGVTGFSELTLTGNRYYAGGENQWKVNGSVTTFANWVAETGETGSVTQVSYSDPTRSIATYMASLGYAEGDQTTAKFLELARANSKADWDTDFTADAVNDYIRAGFEE